MNVNVHRKRHERFLTFDLIQNELYLLASDPLMKGTEKTAQERLVQPG